MRPEERSQHQVQQRAVPHYHDNIVWEQRGATDTRESGDIFPWRARTQSWTGLRHPFLPHSPPQHNIKRVNCWNEYIYTPVMNMTNHAWHICFNAKSRNTARISSALCAFEETINATTENWERNCISSPKIVYGVNFKCTTNCIKNQKV